jgi:hypothetical protein
MLAVGRGRWTAVVALDNPSLSTSYPRVSAGLG